MEAVAHLNSLLDSFDQFRVRSFNGHRLVILGSSDIAYHHDFEVEFDEVSYTQCPTDFFADTFRVATAEEQAQLKLADYIDEEHIFFCFESDGRPFFIVAKSLKIREGRVLHYK